MIESLHGAEGATLGLLVVDLAVAFGFELLRPGSVFTRQGKRRPSARFEGDEVAPRPGVQESLA